MGQNASPRAQNRPKNTCLSMPSGLGTTLEKWIFSGPGTLLDPPLAPTICAWDSPPAPPSDHWYGGVDVSLGDYEAWKPQKVGGCRWSTCPRISDLSHVAQDTAHFWCWGRLTQTAHSGPFLAIFLGVLGHLGGVVARCAHGAGLFRCFRVFYPVERPTTNHSGGCSQMLVDGHQRPLGDIWCFFLPCRAFFVTSWWV